MTSAFIAYQHLDETARREVDRLIKLNPEYKKWTAGISDPDQKALVAFMRASLWADDIKFKSGYRNDGSTPPASPNSSRNIGYSDKLQHRYWHFINLPFSMDGTALREPPAVNAVTQAEVFRIALKSAQTKAAIRSYDLVWLIHMVGDLHQPLHCVARFTATLPAGDQGGNQVKICSRKCSSNLHSFWDGAAGDGDIDDAMALGESLDEEGAHGGPGVPDLAAWAKDGLAFAESIVYVDPIKPDGPSSTNATYRGKAREAAEKQLRLAGHRLADLLNEALGKTN